MEWNTSELTAIRPILNALEQETVGRNVGVRNTILELSLSAASALANGCPSPGAQLVRHVCAAMGFNESRLTNLRLEHKLVQALVLSRYCREAIPVTHGVGSALEGVASSSARRFLSSQYPPSSVFIKRALNYGSAERKDADAREECLAALDKGEDVSVVEKGLEGEVYILQERVEIAKEFRIHTVEGNVAADLTYRRYRGGGTPSEREAVNAFVQEVLDRLPDALVSGVVAAWDVASTPEGQFRVVEVNVTGWHSVYVPGFHCSGYFQGRWAAPAMAKLAVELERRYGVTFAILRPEEGPTALCDVFGRFSRWLELQRLARTVERLSELAPTQKEGDEAAGAVSARGPAEERAFLTLLGELQYINTQLRMLT